MNYHPFTDEGHHCPGCGGAYLCTMEDGHCENTGACRECSQAERDRMSDGEREWREMKQAEYDEMWQ